MNAPPDGPPTRAEHTRGGRPRGNGNRRANGRSNNNGEAGTERRQDNRQPRRGRGGFRGSSDDAARPPSMLTRAGPAEENGSLQDNDTSQSQRADRTDAVNEEVEAEVCFICASPVVHNSVAPCNHRTCHICALRMRALYKNKDCAHCRTEAQYVIFTDDPAKRYLDFGSVDIVNTDENIGIRYENPEIVEDTLLLLRYNCPDETCDVACMGWPDLHRHVRSTHHKKMCDLCTRNKKVFTHEHDLFTDRELEKHMKKGDDNPGAIDQSGFTGHPLCGFCGQRFYGSDELYVHCREKHERCFLCDQASGGQPQYYLNYDTLALHFRKDHFMCPERECLDQKFVVFASELDLKGHQLKEHGNTLSKDVRRDARTVDISNFDYRAPYIQERPRGGSQRESRARGGRGRDPNADPIPASSAQPMRRDEQAFQRQMAIHSAQSVTNRTFGGQLTASTPAAAARAPAGTSEPATITAPGPVSATRVEQLTAQMSNADLGISSANTPQDQARRLRHANVIERASVLLQNDAIKLNQFRSSISSFQRNNITASALIDAFFALFDTTSANLGSLIRDIADLYEDPVKSSALRTAWNDWRAINEDYPSLPGPSGMSGNSLPGGWAAVTASTPSAPSSAPPKSTSRVLRLKSSTAASSKSQASRSQTWGASSNASSSGSASHAAATAFPGLPPASSFSVPRAPPLRTTATPWLNITSAPASTVRSTPSSARPTPPPSRPASVRPHAGTDNFPSLPPAPKPSTTIFGYGTGMVRRDGGGGGQASGFSWGAQGEGGDGGGAGGEEAESAGGKKRGNKGKKQVLNLWA